MDWQPIETAPKDGREIELARFKPDKHNNWVCIGQYDGTDSDDAPCWLNIQSDDECWPTHWREHSPPST